MSQFKKNLVFNIASQGGTLALQLWYTRVLYQSLGTEVYGLVPLTVGFVLYLGLLTSSASIAIRRHLTVALASDDSAQARTILGVAIKSMALLLVPIVIIATILIWKLPYIIDIPVGQENHTRFLAFSVFLSFGLNQLLIPYSATVFAINRLDVRAVISLMEMGIRAFGVWLLFQFFTPSLISVGSTLLASSLFAAFSTIYAQKLLLPAMSPRLRGSWDRTVFLDMIRTGVWITASMVGGILMVGIDLLVINRLKGPEDAGNYAPVLQLVSGFRSVAGMLGALFAPTLMSLFGRGEIDTLVEYSRRSVRFFGLMMALPLGLICGYSKAVLEVWLGSGHSTNWVLVIILVGSLSISLSEQPLFQLQVAANRVKIPAIATLCAGILNVVLAIIACMAYGVVGVALTGAFISIMKGVVFTPLYNSHILGIAKRKAFAGIHASFLSFAITFGLAYFAGWAWPPATAIEMIVSFSVTALVSIFCLIILVLDDNERKDVLGYFTKARRWASR